VTAIALIVAALLVAGGGTAAARIVTKHKGSKRAASSQPAASPAADSKVTATPPEATPRAKPSAVPVTPPPVDNTPTPTPTPPKKPSNGGSGAGERAAVAAAVQAHWDAIGNHDFDTAYDYFASSYGGSRANWVRTHQNDRITSVNASLTGGNVRGSYATANVVSLQTDSRDGCRDWSGYYDMVKEGGEWKIVKAHLTFVGC
jgi:hypothetical protein